jgi:hypothetical protein
MLLQKNKSQTSKNDLVIKPSLTYASLPFKIKFVKQEKKERSLQNLRTQITIYNKRSTFSELHGTSKT